LNSGTLPPSAQEFHVHQAGGDTTADSTEHHTLDLMATPKARDGVS